jgi:hypothetical protein
VRAPTMYTLWAADQVEDMSGSGLEVFKYANNTATLSTNPIIEAAIQRADTIEKWAHGWKMMLAGDNSVLGPAEPVDTRRHYSGPHKVVHQRQTSYFRRIAQAAGNVV